MENVELEKRVDIQFKAIEKLFDTKFAFINEQFVLINRRLDSLTNNMKWVVASLIVPSASMIIMIFIR